MFFLNDSTNNTIPCLRVKFHFWTNSTSHFTLLGTTFMRVWPKKDAPSFIDLVHLHTPVNRPSPLQLSTWEFVRKKFFSVSICNINFVIGGCMSTDWQQNRRSISIWSDCENWNKNKCRDKIQCLFQINGYAKLSRALHPKSEPSQISKIELFAKEKLFHKRIHPRCLTGFWYACKSFAPIVRTKLLELILWLIFCHVIYTKIVQFRNTLCLHVVFSNTCF